MKTCTSCGNELMEGAAFCTKCGAKTKKINPELAGNGFFVSETQDKRDTVDSSEVQEKGSKTISKAKENLQQNGYLNYLSKTMTQPSAGVSMVNATYAWVQLAVLSLLSTVSIYFLIKTAYSTSMNTFGLSPAYGISHAALGEIRNALLPRILVVSVLMHLAFAAAAFFILKFTAKEDFSFTQILNDIGSLLTPNLALFLLSILISILFTSENTLIVSVILVALALNLYGIAFNYYIYNKINSEKLDKLYVMLLGNLLVVFLIVVIIYIQVEPALTMLQQIERWFYILGW